VREDYSENGDAWNFFTHDHARSRAYRWGEDGIAGLSDDQQHLCFALALWNGKDTILKERLFGLTNSEGSRRPDESPDSELQAFYQRLLTETAREVFRNGRWRFCDRSGWADNPSHLNIMGWCWEMGDERHLVAVNFSDTPSQAVIRMFWDDLWGRAWRLSELLSAESYERGGDEMAESGLFVSLGPWQWHFFRLDPVS